MKYLQGTKDFMLTYKRSDNLEVVKYLNLDFVGCVDSSKSTSGYMFIFVERAISWKSTNQSRIATFTKEAEFVSCFEATLQDPLTKGTLAKLFKDHVSRMGLSSILSHTV
ncbi:Copia-like pol polyprotein, putative [Theobroma cacao]|uniref:Copia-like pol polyprotein, putative n=1 Tax=Theobroma cacao TaxID=3641 RepID=A0A061DTG6_THECC|nr:Copia-like pol polyprotein, putative [Theobroma cacao]